MRCADEGVFPKEKGVKNVKMDGITNKMPNFVHYKKNITIKTYNYGYFN